MRGRRPLRYVAAGLLLVSAVTLNGETLYAATGARSVARALRRTKPYDSLTGLWTGAYFYPFHNDGVPFNAEIEDSAGALTGHIDEPNTMLRATAPHLRASLRGSRTGADVSFIKRYDGASNVSHTVGYEGVVNAEFTRIDGQWALPNLSGAFFMERAEAGAEAAAERAAEAST